MGAKLLSFIAAVADRILNGFKGPGSYMQPYSRRNLGLRYEAKDGMVYRARVSFLGFDYLRNEIPVLSLYLGHYPPCMEYDQVLATFD